MLTKILFSASLALVPSQGASTQIAIDSVGFRACQGARNCSGVTRLRIDSNKRDLYVVCNIRNNSAPDDDFFVLASTEYKVAPRTVYSVEDFQRLRSEVSWSRIATQGDDMGTAAMRALRPGMTRELAIKIFDPASLAQKFRGDSDSLWPWLARVNILVVDRNGQMIASSSAILEIEPSPPR